MTLNIQLPRETERRLRDRAKAERVSADDLASNLLIGALGRAATPKDDPLDEWLDHECHAECEREVGQSDALSLEAVRKILSKIPGNMSDEIIADREER